MLVTNMDKFPANEKATDAPLKVLKVKNYYGLVNLISSGGNVEDKNSFGQTLLHESANHGEFGACLALWLLKKGADVNAETKFMQCALHFCIINTNTTFTKVILNEGINVNVDDKYGDTALKWLEDELEDAEGNQKQEMEKIKTILMNYGG